MDRLTQDWILRCGGELASGFDFCSMTCRVAYRGKTQRSYFLAPVSASRESRTQPSVFHSTASSEFDGLTFHRLLCKPDVLGSSQTAQRKECCRKRAERWGSTRR